jgi:glycosyltransferase involved in cell wall biosynthesis
VSGALAIAFWVAAAAIAWIFVSFPLVLGVRALRPRRLAIRNRTTPSIGLVIVVHNEAAVIEAKLANLEAARYPRDRLQVIVVSDGSDDGTNQLVAAHAGPTPVELISLGRVGKNAALNAGVAAVRAEIVVLSDADSLLEPDALIRIAAPFGDPDVGAVAGDFRYAATHGEGRGERSYWNMDRAWRWLESRAGSATSATGQLYAVRRALCSRVPDGVTDDFCLSTGAIAAGKRLWYEPGAVARGPVAAAPDAEFHRKVRMIGRGFASVWHRRSLLDPRTSGFYAIQLFTHKVARRLIAVPLVVLAVTAPLLATAHPLYRLAAVLQILFHGLALAGFALRGRPVGRAAALSLPLAFDTASLAGSIAFARFLRGRSEHHWVPDRRAPRAIETATSPSSPENA